ncbi:19870_t:CDS:2 [Cetraspora pellucida]|uniref:19870_t:CDS:1 n=1 Tax=Cetraspora pellucida TaxID=1433469 RepID=A0A9N9IER8_9GLOM|nr:19870_t:CDS:2 [Cetraspora pellucida]
MIVKTSQFITLFVFIILPLYVFVNAIPASNPGFVKIHLRRVHTSEIDPGLLSLLKRDPQGKEYINNYEDLRYTSSMIIGGQNISLLIDTGSSDLWVPSVYCSSSACTNGSRYDPAKSTTYKPLPVPNNFTLSYDDGSAINGFKATETVTIGGLSITQQPFGVVTTFNSNGFRGGGVMGIKFSPSRRFNATGVIQTMKAQKVINKALVGIHLGATKVNANDASYVTFGDIPNEYANSISYNKVVENNRWTISMSDILLDGNSLGIKAITLVDTGAALIYGPSSQVIALHGKLSGSSFSNNIWWIPCDTKSVISIVLNGIPYEINPLEFVKRRNSTTGLCRSGIQQQPRTNITSWTLGHPFLTNVIAAFDYDNLQIGFASTLSGTETPGNGPVNGNNKGNDNGNFSKKSESSPNF